MLFLPCPWTLSEAIPVSLCVRQPNHSKHTVLRMREGDEFPSVVGRETRQKCMMEVCRVRGQGAIAPDRWWGSALKPHSADPPCMQPQAPAGVAVATGARRRPGSWSDLQRGALGFLGFLATQSQPPSAQQTLSKRFHPTCCTPSRCIATERRPPARRPRFFTTAADFFCCFCPAMR